MAISKQRKVELVEEYVEQITQSKGMVLADYRGLSVKEMSEIRNAMRPIGGELHVVKNRLLKLALERTEVSLPDEWLIGPTAIGFCYEEIPPVVKILTDATKDMETLRIKGGLMGSSVIAEEQVRAIAALPPRETLMSQVLGGINAPAGRMAGVVSSGIRQIVNVLQAYVDKLQESEGTASPAMEQAAEPV